MGLGAEPCAMRGAPDSIVKMLDRLVKYADRLCSIAQNIAEPNNLTPNMIAVGDGKDPEQN
jgi:hypothetical protein